MGRKRKLPEGIRERGGAYYADFYAQGRRVRKRLSTQLDVATTLLHEMQARADKADFGILDNDYAISELKEKYLRQCRQTLKPRSVERYEVSMDTILARLGFSRVGQISVDAVLHYRQQRLSEGLSPRTVNHDVMILAAMLRWGVKPAQLIGSNPLTAVKPLRHDNPKNGRPLTDLEVQALLGASKQPWRDIWYAFLTTGLRKEELTTLTFEDIDWESREIVVRGGVAKNHTARRIPLDSSLWSILKQQHRNSAGRQPGKGKTPGRTHPRRPDYSRLLDFDK